MKNSKRYLYVSLPLFDAISGAIGISIYMRSPLAPTLRAGIPWEVLYFATFIGMGLFVHEVSIARGSRIKVRSNWEERLVREVLLRSCSPRFTLNWPRPYLEDRISTAV